MTVNDTNIQLLNTDISVGSPVKQQVEISSNTSIASTDCDSAIDVPEEAVLLVDPWSTGDALWKELETSGYKVVIVWENDFIRSHKRAADVLMHDNLESTLLQIKQVLSQKYYFVAVVAGSETAVPLAETIANGLSLPTNSPSKALARRNKYLMGEALREAGVRAVKQKITTDINEALNFVNDHLIIDDTFNVIVKPNMGAGSDDVYLCKTKEDFIEKFNLVNGKINSLGIKNDGVLVQEYLTGTEYVVDSVSVEGQHYVSAIWRYDKRPANNRFNVYFASFPVPNNSSVSEQLINYVKQVLGALQIHNGPSHAEIKLTPSGPCLVEIGARCHGGGGCWMPLADKCFGMNQVKNAIKSIKKEPIESYPTELKHYGAIADMIYYEAGTILDFDGESLLWELESVKEVAFYNKVGDVVKKTVDCNTQPGHILLFHEDSKVVEKDIKVVHKLLKDRKVFRIR